VFVFDFIKAGSEDVFGFVTIDKPELKFKDYEVYRGVYCSLCKALGKNYSVFARFILNYDCTFLSLFILSRESTCHGFKQGRCRFNPMKRCSYLKNADSALNKGAALTIISSYYKLLDSIADGGFFKKVGCTLIRPFFASWHKKAKRSFPRYEEILKEMFTSQLEIEKSEDAFLDLAAEPTAKMLQAVFKAEAKDRQEEKILSEFGYHLGRWIYLMDGACDLRDDAKSRSFNPFLLKFKSLEDADIKEIDGILSLSYFRLSKAYELLSFDRYKDILDNIILSGLAARQKSIIDSLNPERKS